ncbi:hypothetical protein P7C73_g5165, partial [Tremellales sp. Uapishka_1]
MSTSPYPAYADMLPRRCPDGLATEYPVAKAYWEAVRNADWGPYVNIVAADAEFVMAYHYVDLLKSLWTWKLPAPAQILGQVAFTAGDFSPIKVWNVDPGFWFVKDYCRRHSGLSGDTFYMGESALYRVAKGLHWAKADAEFVLKSEATQAARQLVAGADAAIFYSASGDRKHLGLRPEDEDSLVDVEELASFKRLLRLADSNRQGIKLAGAHYVMTGETGQQPTRITVRQNGRFSKAYVMPDGVATTDRSRQTGHSPVGASSSLGECIVSILDERYQLRHEASIATFDAAMNLFGSCGAMPLQPFDFVPLPSFVDAPDLPKRVVHSTSSLDIKPTTAISVTPFIDFDGIGMGDLSLTNPAAVQEETLPPSLSRTSRFVRALSRGLGWLAGSIRPSEYTAQAASLSADRSAIAVSQVVLEPAVEAEPAVKGKPAVVDLDKPPFDLPLLPKPWRQSPDDTSLPEGDCVVFVNVLKAVEDIQRLCGAIEMGLGLEVELAVAHPCVGVIWMKDSDKVKEVVAYVQKESVNPPTAIGSLVVLGHPDRISVRHGVHLSGQEYYDSYRCHRMAAEAPYQSSKQARMGAAALRRSSNRRSKVPKVIQLVARPLYSLWLLLRHAIDFYPLARAVLTPVSPAYGVSFATSTTLSDESQPLLEDWLLDYIPLDRDDTTTPAMPDVPVPDVLMPRAIIGPSEMSWPPPQQRLLSAKDLQPTLPHWSAGSWSEVFLRLSRPTRFFVLRLWHIHLVSWVNVFKRRREFNDVFVFFPDGVLGLDSGGRWSDQHHGVEFNKSVEAFHVPPTERPPPPVLKKSAKQNRARSYGSDTVEVVGINPAHVWQKILPGPPDEPRWTSVIDQDRVYEWRGFSKTQWDLKMRLIAEGQTSTLATRRSSAKLVHDKVNVFMRRYYVTFPAQIPRALIATDKVTLTLSDPVEIARFVQFRRMLVGIQSGKPDIVIDYPVGLFRSSLSK